MAATRLLRSSRPLGLRLPSSPSPSYSTLSSKSTITMNLSRGVDNEREKRISGGGGEKKVPSGTLNKAVAVAERVNVVSEPQTNDLVGAGGVDLAWLLRKVSTAALVILKMATKPRPPRLLTAQMFIERSVIDCRFFALFAVAGSLLGSVLCFLEGFFLVIESYVRYFNMLSQNSDKGHMVQLLIEAIDMFLVGTALLIFGMGVHVMFVGSNHLKAKSPVPVSNLFGLFHLKKLPRWACMQSVTQAKSKIGHAILMILQVGVLEKFKNVPLVTGLDLACFAAAIFLSSACVFLLSRLSIGSIASQR